MQFINLLIAMMATLGLVASGAPLAGNGIGDQVWRESYSKLNQFLNRDVKSEDEELNMRVAIEFYNDKYRSISISNDKNLMAALENFIALPSIISDDLDKSCSEESDMIASENVRGLGRNGQGRRIDRVVAFYVERHRDLCDQ